MCLSSRTPVAWRQPVQPHAVSLLQPCTPAANGRTRTGTRRWFFRRPCHHHIIIISLSVSITPSSSSSSTSGAIVVMTTITNHVLTDHYDACICIMTHGQGFGTRSWPRGVQPYVAVSLLRLCTPAANGRTRTGTRRRRRHRRRHHHHHHHRSSRGGGRSCSSRCRSSRHHRHHHHYRGSRSSHCRSCLRGLARALRLRQATLGALLCGVCTGLLWHCGFRPPLARSCAVFVSVCGV